MRWPTLLTGQPNEIYCNTSNFVHQSNPPQPLTNGLKSFRFWSCFHRVIRIFLYLPTLSYCGVGWSDLALFAIFEKLQVSAVQVYFQEAKSKKLANFSARVRVAGAAKFSFSKNLRDLKYEYFLQNLQNPSFKEHQRTISEKKICN